MDRLGSLPDDILHIILSNLPILSQVETSLLSPRWRQLWSANPVVSLLNGPISMMYNDQEQNSLLLHELLRSWQATHILEVRANFGLRGMNIGLRNSALVNEWIDFAASRSLQHLNLEYRHGPPFCRYIERGQGLPSLEKLSLKMVPLTGGPPFARYIRTNLYSLKVLHLDRVSITDDDFDTLISACPLLELLKIKHCKELRHMLISSSSLKVLLVNDCHFQLLKLDATPNLMGLECLLLRDQIVSVQNEIPHLIDVSLLSISPDRLLPMVPSISHVRTLSINLELIKELVQGYKTEISQPDIFRNLKELHLTVNQWLTGPLLNALHVFLGERPSIEKLCIQIGTEVRRPILSSWFENVEDETTSIVHQQSRQVSESNTTKALSGQFNNYAEMKFVRLIGLLGTTKEISLIKFLLGSATNLDLMHIFCRLSTKENFVEQLSMFPRASSDVRIMVSAEKEDMDMLCQSMQLFDYVKVAEDFKDACICSRHFDSNPVSYVRAKSVYVHQNKGKQTTDEIEDGSHSFSKRQKR